MVYFNLDFTPVVAAIPAAFVTPFGGYFGYKGGKNFAEIILKGIYGDDFKPRKQSIQAKIITKGVGVIGAAAAGIFTFGSLTYIFTKILKAKSI